MPLARPEDVHERRGRAPPVTHEEVRTWQENPASRAERARSPRTRPRERARVPRTSTSLSATSRTATSASGSWRSDWLRSRAGRRPPGAHRRDRGEAQSHGRRARRRQGRRRPVRGGLHRLRDCARRAGCPRTQDDFCDRSIPASSYAYSPRMRGPSLPAMRSDALRPALPAYAGTINRPAYEERDLQVFPCANGGVSMAFEADEVALVVFRVRFELTLFDVSDVLVEVRAVWRVPSRNREGGGQ